MIRKTILPFKLEMTKDIITLHAGLALLGEFAAGYRGKGWKAAGQI